MPQLMLQLLTIQLEPLSLFPHVTTTLHTPMKIRKCEIIKLRPRSRLQNKSNCTHLLGDCKLSSVYVLHFFLPGTELAPRQRYKSDDHPVSLHSQPLLQRGNGHVALLNGTWAEGHMNSQVTALGKKKANFCPFYPSSSALNLLTGGMQKWSSQPALPCRWGKSCKWC